MTELKQIYKCAVCGNIVEVIHTGAGELVCCGQAMAQQEENTVDAAQEKHVPVIEKKEDGITVRIGEVAHPMDEDHYIEWIELVSDNGITRKYLKPGEAAELSCDCEGECSCCGGAGTVKARAYCNIHGLWSAEG